MSAFIKHLFACLALGMAVAASHAAVITNTVTFNFQDILQRAYVNRAVTIESVSTPRTNQPNIAVNYYLSTNTGTAGGFTLADMLDGTYRVSVLGNPRPTTFLIAVPTNNPATLYASDLLTTNIDANATTAWTRSQADSRFVRANSTNGVLVNPTNFFWANITNGANVAIARGAGGKITISSTNSGGPGGSSVGTNIFVNGVLAQPARLTNTASVTWATNAGGDIEATATGGSGEFSQYTNNAGTGITITTNSASNFTFAANVRISGGTNVSSIQTNTTGGVLSFTINTTDTSGGGSGELWTTNASLLALASSNAVNLTNIVGGSLITNVIHIFNRPDWPHAGSGNFRNATNETSFFAAVDNGELQANTVYEFAPGTYNFTNANFLRSNTIVRLNGARLVLGTNATQVAEGGKFFAFVSKDYYSGGASISGGTIELQAHLNANFTNAMGGIYLAGNGKEFVEGVHIQNPKGNQASGSECFAIAVWPANNLANAPLLYAPSVRNSSVTFTNGNENQSYVTAISVGGSRDTNVVAAQGWGSVEGCVVIGPGKGFGWSHGYSAFGRTRLMGNHAAGLLRGAYHELQSGGNASTDNGMMVLINNSFERTENGVEVTGYLTNSNFRITGNVFSNYTRGVYFSNVDASDATNNAVGQIFDVMIDHNHFGVAGTNPHWNIYLRNVGGSSMISHNTMHSTSNYFGTGSVTNMTATNVVPIALWMNSLTNGEAATTNLAHGDVRVRSGSLDADTSVKSATLQTYANTPALQFYRPNHGDNFVVRAVTNIGTQGEFKNNLNFGFSRNGSSFPSTISPLLMLGTNGSLTPGKGAVLPNLGSLPGNASAAESWQHVIATNLLLLGDGALPTGTAGLFATNEAGVTNIYAQKSDGTSYRITQTGGGGSSVGTNIFVNGTLVQPASLTNSATVTWAVNGNGFIEATAAGGGAGTMFPTNYTGATNHIAMWGGNSNAVLWTNTISANISLAGVPTNSLLAIGEDGFATNATLNANQFETNLATATAGPGYSIKSGALVTNLVIDAGRVTNILTVSNSGSILVTNGARFNASHALPLVAPNAITFSNSSFQINHRTTAALGIAPAGTERMSIGGAVGANINFNNTVNGGSGLWWGISGIADNQSAPFALGSANTGNAMSWTSIETNGHRSIMLQSTNRATHGGTNFIQFTTQITNAAAGANTTNLVIYFRDPTDGSFRRGTITLQIE